MPPVGKAQYLWGVGAIRRGAAALGLPPQLARLRRAGGLRPPAAAPHAGSFTSAKWNDGARAPQGHLWYGSPALILQAR